MVTTSTREAPHSRPGPRLAGLAGRSSRGSGAAGQLRRWEWAWV